MNIKIAILIIPIPLSSQRTWNTEYVAPQQAGNAQGLPVSSNKEY